MLANID